MFKEAEIVAAQKARVTTGTRQQLQTMSVAEFKQAVGVQSFSIIKTANGRFMLGDNNESLGPVSEKYRHGDACQIVVVPDAQTGAPVAILSPTGGEVVGTL